MSIHGRRWGALLIALLLVTLGNSTKAARADEGDGTAWLGVYTQELSDELQEALDHDGNAVLVTRVVPDSPADRAGIRKGDLIERVNSESVDSPSELAREIRSKAPGDQVRVRIVRDGDPRTLSVTLASRNGDDETPAPQMKRHSKGHDADGDKDEDDGDHEGHDRTFNFEMPEMPDAPEAPDAPNAPNLFDVPGMGRARLGVRIETLNPDLAEYFDVKDGRGVLVLDVMKGTPAERIGMKPGDVIVRVDDRDIADSDDLIRAIGEARGKVEVDAIRHGARKTFQTELSSAREPRILRLQRGNGWNGNGWRFEGNGWRRGSASSPDASDRSATDRELQELREELKELKQDLKELRDR